MPQAQKLVYHSTLGSRGIKKKKKKNLIQALEADRVRFLAARPRPLPTTRPKPVSIDYRGTSLIRTPPPVGPYSSPMPRDLW